MFTAYHNFDHHVYNQQLGHEFEDLMSTNHKVIIKPTNKELDGIANDIQDIFQDGINWADLPIIMKIAAHYLNEFSNLSLESKRDSVIYILNYVVDHTDTPYLPDTFFDPLFKSMAPHFVNVIIPQSLDEYLTPIKISGVVTENLIKEYAEEIFETFEDGFNWKDLVMVTRLSISFAHQFTDLNFQEKKEAANAFVSHIIDNTDTPRLPDFFVDPIFKEVSESVIEIIMDQLLIHLR